MLDQQELQQALQFSIKLAEQSGSIARQYFRRTLSIDNKAGEGDFDPVTQADKEIEAYIRKQISEAYPTYGIVGEEFGNEEGTESCTWFVDPIDGTAGYMIGSPMWGTLIGLLDEGKPAFGLMHQPIVHETYVGSAQGAFIVSRDGKQSIQSSQTREIEDAVLCCTRRSMFETTQDQSAYDRVVDACKLERQGTDCWGYTLLAHGLVDIVIENGLKPYDAVPLVPIVEAAGGRMTDWSGAPTLQGGRVVATANAELHEKVLTELIKD